MIFYPGAIIACEMTETMKTLFECAGLVAAVLGPASHKASKLFVGKLLQSCVQFLHSNLSVSTGCGFLQKMAASAGAVKKSKTIWKLFCVSANLSHSFLNS